MQSSLYLCVKSLHIISVVAWMAGILYLFRLFVYHAEEKETVVKQRFCVMERRLYRYITLPAMVSTILFGASLVALDISLLRAPWVHTKLLLVAGLIGMTLFGASQLDELEAGSSRVSGRLFRILNEVPMLILIGIVFLAVFKPF
jgi:putative membrane protein